MYSFASIKIKNICQKKIEKICFKYGLHQHLCNEPQTLQPLSSQNTTEASICDSCQHFIIQRAQHFHGKFTATAAMCHVEQCSALYRIKVKCGAVRYRSLQ